jgi:RnfABCDGE-type electron transport complex D subunit
LTDESPKKTLKPKRGWILWQKPMVGTLTALTPAALFGIYNFGWRAALVICTSLLVSLLAEGFFTIRQGKPITSAVLVTGMLFGLIMPPSVPLWIVAVGALFGVVFGKMVFGGFGMNPYNPAMTGRCFVYISFPVAMTSYWNQGEGFFPRGLGTYLVDSMTGATPMVAAESGNSVDLWQALFGFTGGSIGETSFVLVALGGAYVMYKKWAAWQTVASITFFAVTLQTIFWLTEISPIDPLYMVMTGGFALGVLFMATDPVSSAATKEGKFVFGAIIGLSTVLIRTFGNFAEGFMFALLLGNTFAPIVDYAVRERQKAKKAKAAAKKEAGQ